MKKRYKVFAALYEDSNAGWIWMPEENIVFSRDIITIKVTSTRKKVNCICRIMDHNFLFRYNQHPRKEIERVEESIVISDYYRNKLGGIKTGKIYEFEIKRVWRFNYFRKVIVLLQHPDNAIKIATYLALWSLLLGSVGIIIGLISIFSSC